MVLCEPGMSYSGAQYCADLNVCSLLRLPLSAVGAGDADAMTAAAKAVVILADMVLFSWCRSKSPLRTKIVKGAVLFPGFPFMGQSQSPGHHCRVAKLARPRRG